MSAARRYRRGRFTPRQPDIELSAECRRRLAEVISAHDDPKTDVATFASIGVAFSVWILTRPDAERLEAAAQLAEVSSRNLTGRPRLEVAGWIGMQ